MQSPEQHPFTIVSDEMYDFIDLTINHKRRERERERERSEMHFSFRPPSLMGIMNLLALFFLRTTVRRGYIMDNVQAVGITCFTHHKPPLNLNLAFT